LGVAAGAVAWLIDAEGCADVGGTIAADTCDDDGAFSSGTFGFGMGGWDGFIL